MVGRGPVGLVLDGRYKLERVIGNGSKGTVFKGVQELVDRPIAVKVLHSMGDVDRQRFKREAKSLARLDHPNCVRFYDFGHSSEINAYYMVLEYLRGRTLDELRAQLDHAAAIQIIRQVSDALAHAHAQDVLHRDLKPSNIMLARTQTGKAAVKVLDFGLAKLLDSGGDDPSITQSGHLYGDFRYMSPEQSRGAMVVGPPTDVYALGTILYELLEGDIPFRAEEPQDILVQKAHHTPEAFSVYVPKPIEKLIFEMLLKDEKARPTAAVVTERLERYEAGESGSGETGDEVDMTDVEGWSTAT